MFRHTDIATSTLGPWAGLASRERKVSKVYACNDVGDDLLLFGEVDWVFKSGGSAHAGFAARALIDLEVKDGGPRLKLFQWWLVSTAFLSEDSVRRIAISNSWVSLGSF